VSGGPRIAELVCTDLFAGSEQYVANLSGGLAARGCDVVVFGGNQHRMRTALADTGAESRPAPTTLGAAAALFRGRRFDIVHAHMTAAETAAVMSWPRQRAPIVATRHFAQRRGSSPTGRLLGRILTPCIARQLAISQFVAERVEGPTVVVFPGSAVNDPPPAAADREPVVLMAQRLETEKRADLGLRVWQQSGLAAAGWRLDVAGDGAELPRLQELAVSLGIHSSCHFLGPRDDVPDLLRRSAIFLAPRPDEPFGMSVIEAMAAGLPVVAADGGGHRETVGATTGAVLYPPHDTAAGGAALAELARDEASRAAYGEALRTTHQEHFSVDAQVDATLDVYRSLLP
jgi:glycosyltransferase involved in cell wall biosynthesis